MSPLRVVLTGSLAGQPQGGGHFSALLQHLLGLRALGHEVFWLDLFTSTGDRDQDAWQIQLLRRRFHTCGLRDRFALLLFDQEPEEPELAAARIVGMSRKQVAELARSSDLLWNFCSALRRPLLSLFPHRVLVDLDPGILQVCARHWDVGLQDHHAFLTVGTKLHDRDCQVPTFGKRWFGFTPPVHLPMWRSAPDPGPQAPFSSITEWTWHTLDLEDRLLSASKRDAYLRLRDLPRCAGGPFELAANIDPEDDTGDREQLREAGWRLVHPYQVADSPASYRRYIRRSRAEIGCAKPIYRELRTGWFSDRSACYLASGRPVLAEDTGFSDHLPTGRGLFAFRTLEEAAAGAEEIVADYASHMRAARELAEEFFDSRRCLEAMLRAC